MSSLVILEAAYRFWDIVRKKTDRQTAEKTIPPRYCRQRG